MTTPVKPEPVASIPTYDEWQAAQYGPHRFGQDPKAQMPMGRIPTYDEWQQLQSSANPSKLTFPALPTPKFVADQTKRLNPNAGKPDQSILESIASPVFSSEPIKKAAAMADVVGASLGPLGAPLTVGATLARQVVAPVVEHPIMTAAGIAAAAASPIVVGGAFTADMLHNVAKYGYQVVQEQMMSPEERAVAQKDPNRISGEAAFVQAVLAGLTIKGVGHAVGKAADVSQGVMESGAAALRPYVQSEPGATALGAAAAERGLPATASPYPPATPLDAAWLDGYEKPRVKIPGTVEQIAPPVTPEAAPSGSVAGGAPRPGLAPIEGTGELKTRGLARGIEEKAISNRLTNLFEGLPEYRAMNTEHQGALAARFLAENPERARAVALGEEPAPEGLLSSSVLVAVEDRATLDGDVALIHELGTRKSGLTAEATAHGQWTRMLGERDPDSPVGAVRNLATRREGGAKAGRFVQRAVKEIEKHTGISADQIAEFINSIRC